MSEVKKQREKQELKRALELKALRDRVIPMFRKVIEKYDAEVKFLDTDAYVSVGGRGIYIPYTTDEIHLDLKLDNFVHDYGSASKHKMRAKLEQSLDGLDNKKSGGFWNADVDIKSFDTSLNRRH
ncbi:MAG: hypothetical protein WCX79_00980 [Candidatus Paceibacterota bacterium]|jgi:hypothetical protein